MILSDLRKPVCLISVFLFVTSVLVTSLMDNAFQTIAFAQSRNDTQLISDQQAFESDITNANNTSTSVPDSQLVVFAEDLEEIRDNLAEAQDALSRGKLVDLSQHINNIDRLVSIILLTNSSLVINPWHILQFFQLISKLYMSGLRIAIYRRYDCVVPIKSICLNFKIRAINSKFQLCKSCTPSTIKRSVILNKLCQNMNQWKI